MLPPLPTGSASQSGAPPSCSMTSNARGLLALQPERVDRVQQRERAALDQLPHHLQGVVEVALDRRPPGRRRSAPGPASAGDRALGQDDDQPDAGPAAVGGRRRRGVAGGGADGRRGALLERLGDGHRHAPVLERAGRVRALVLEVAPRPPVARRSAARAERRVALAERHDRGCVSVTGSRSRYRSISPVSVAASPAGMSTRFSSSSTPGSRIAMTRSPGSSSVSPTAISARPSRLTEISRERLGQVQLAHQPAGDGRVARRSRTRRSRGSRGADRAA